MTGNCRVPANVHKLKGTYDPRIHGEEADVPIGIPEQPAWLTPEGKKQWDILVNLLKGTGYLTTLDGIPLGGLAELIAELAENPKALSVGKLTQLRLLMGDFGLTPVSRAKIKLPTKNDKPNNPFEGM